MRRGLLFAAAVVGMPLALILSCNLPTQTSGSNGGFRALATQTMSAGGNVSSTQARQMYGLITAPNGDLYGTDSIDHTIKQYTAGGAYAGIIAGAANTPGFLDSSSGTAARFNYPRGIAIDDSGANLYVVENYANCVRKITVGGSHAVTRIAGIRTPGTADGGNAGTWTASPGTGIAQFSGPWDCAWDKTTGTLVVSDSGTRKIRRVTPGGTVTTVATMTATPRGICVDSAGWIYIAVPTENKVYSIGPGGAPALKANVTDPWDVSIDVGGNLFIASAALHQVFWVSGNGQVSLWGNGAPGTGNSLNFPYSVAVGNGTANKNHVFVGDTGNYGIRNIDCTGTVPVPTPTPPPPTPTPTPIPTPTPTPVPTPTPTPKWIETIAGNGTNGCGGDGGAVGSASFMSPIGLSYISGTIIVTDPGCDRIRTIDEDTGTINAAIGNGTIGNSGDGGPAPAAKVNVPWGKFDAEVFCDTGNNSIRQVNPTTGIIVTALAGSGLNVPRDCVLTGGYLYVTNAGTNSILKINASTAAVSTFATGFNSPSAIVTDGVYLYVADTGNHCIKRIQISSGSVSVVAGTSGSQGATGDGASATSALLKSPEGVVVRDATTLYVCDTGNNKIRKVAIGGNITLVGGTGTAGFSGDGGIATSAQLNGPKYGVWDPDSLWLYISDTGNHRIRRIFNP